MKVAIIGAGISGLACAYELEKYNIDSVIYEKDTSIGDPVSHMAIFINTFYKEVKDPILYIKKKFGLDLVAVSPIRKIIHSSENRQFTAKGNLGYSFTRGKYSYSARHQILSNIKNPNIIFDTMGDYEMLSKQYDYVVVATGDPNASKQLGNWQTWLEAFVRGATVYGDFNPDTIKFWINRKFCKAGYAYLIPFNTKKASLVLIVPEASENEIDSYWEEFLYTENIKNIITDEFKLHHTSGRVYPKVVNNIYFIGNAGGTLDPFLGFGGFVASIGGIMAAKSIAEGKNYEKLVKKIIQKNEEFYKLRKVFNNLTNKQQDNLVSLMGTPGIKQIVYNTRIDITKYLTKFLN